MKVGFPFNGDQIGGSAVSSINLITSLVRRGVDVTVILHGHGPLVAWAEDAGAKVVFLPKIGTMHSDDRPDRFRFASLLTIWTCLRLIARLKLDIVHVNDLAMLRTWALPCWLSRAKLLAHWRSNYCKSVSVDLALALANHVVAIARYNQAQLPPHARKKSTVEYNPCGRIYSETERSTARERVRAQLGLADGTKLVGVFGSHIVRKRTHVLADVLDAVKHTDAGQPVVGVACGKRAEPYDNEIDQKIEKYRLNGRFIRPGFVQPPEDWMAACDVVLAPAEREPFGRTALEAAQVGVPMIMSSDSGASEFIVPGMTGELVDPYDVDGWVAATRRLLDDEEMAEQFGKAATASLDPFFPEQHAARIESIYRKVMDQ